MSGPQNTFTVNLHSGISWDIFRCYLSSILSEVVANPLCDHFGCNRVIWGISGSIWSSAVLDSKVRALNGMSVNGGLRNCSYLFPSLFLLNFTTATAFAGNT
ncbi:hypothetical protein CDAR_267361 [Caerostris darwini]|uniref:Uncharacterized protein n=1 Tax=Caerostris darwini TaxID=1538125 RepID=A0AAV4TJA7_9ARAC|nr:hypothetical protein CDAR_267361 [Caerostris darwini]